MCLFPVAISESGHKLHKPEWKGLHSISVKYKRIQNSSKVSHVASQHKRGIVGIRIRKLYIHTNTLHYCLPKWKVVFKCSLYCLFYGLLHDMVLQWIKGASLSKPCISKLNESSICMIDGWMGGREGRWMDGQMNECMDDVALVVVSL